MMKTKNVLMTLLIRPRAIKRLSWRYVLEIKYIRPKTPTFRRTPAKYILPSVDASPCATGNHLCKPNTGNLERKPIDNRIKKKE